MSCRQPVGNHDVSPDGVLARETGMLSADGVSHRSVSARTYRMTIRNPSTFHPCGRAADSMLIAYRIFVDTVAV
jgi:hypothetical protein